MKTRDELAEMFAEAFVLSSTGGYSAHADVIVKQAFACADEFVAERERRAVVVPTDSAPVTTPTADKPHDPDAGCAGCERFTPAGVFSDTPVCGARPDRYDLNGSGPSPTWCPKRAPAETAGVKLAEGGWVLDANGMPADYTVDGYDAVVDDGLAVVRIRARDRDHAERIVAAMLPVGRGTK